MTAVICWGFIIVFIIYYCFVGAVLLSNPDSIIGIFGGIATILIGTLTVVILILTMPV